MRTSEKYEIGIFNEDLKDFTNVLYVGIIDNLLIIPDIEELLEDVLFTSNDHNVCFYLWSLKENDLERKKQIWFSIMLNDFKSCVTFDYTKYNYEEIKKLDDKYNSWYEMIPLEHLIILNDAEDYVKCLKLIFGDECIVIRLIDDKEREV
jgi:hypothetical protein